MQQPAPRPLFPTQPLAPRPASTPLGGTPLGASRPLVPGAPAPGAPRPGAQPVPQKPGAPAPNSTSEITKRFGLEPLPESVVQLTRLVARREACADEIAKVVSKDPAISKRLLRFANPKAADESDYVITEVGSALMRTGMSPVILLAMLDPLIRAVIKAFEMGQTQLKHEPLIHWHPFKGTHLLGIVGFSGNATGVVHIRIEPGVAQRLAAAIIGVEPSDLQDPAEVDDVIGELVNIVAGNLKSNLCDAGIPCTLTPPQVERAADCKIITIPGGVSERLGFLAPDYQILVDVSVNPWTE